MRAYIAAHLTEFHLEGVEDDADDVGQANATVAPGSPAPGSGSVTSASEHDAEQAKKKAEQEGLIFQYGIDNIGKGAIEMLKGGWAIVESACGMLSLHGALALVITVLVLSNLWTLLSLRGSQTTAVRPGRTTGRSPRSPPPVPRRVGSRESPDSVADAVKCASTARFLCAWRFADILSLTSQHSSRSTCSKSTSHRTGRRPWTRLGPSRRRSTRSRPGSAAFAPSFPFQQRLPSCLQLRPVRICRV